MKRATTVIMALAVAVTFSFGMMSSEVQAASKPSKVTGIKASRTTSSVTLTWKKAKRTKGYRIYKKTNGKYKRIKTTKSRKYTVKKLKSGKAYYFKVRAYRKVNGKTYWGKTSSTKTVVTKTVSTPNDANNSGENSTTTPSAPTTTVIGGQTITVGGTYDIEPMKNVNLTGDAEKPVLTGVKVTSIDLNNGITYGTTKEGLNVVISENTITVGKAKTNDYDYDIVFSSLGGHAYYTQSNNENTKIYWTCDGTEPKVGQADETGSCEYTIQNSGIAIETQLHGTTCNGSFTIFDKNKTLSHPNIFWLKIYKDGKYIGERYIAYNVK